MSITESPALCSPLMMMSSMGMLDAKPIINDYIEINHVRIIPSQLSFSGAYDGKHFDEKFRIINVGKVPAYVRIFPTTSKAFKMKPLPKGEMLSSGMSIVRHITYTFSTAVALPQVYIYIYINDKPVLYPIEVQIASSLVKISPRMLHFGEIDIGKSSEQLSAFLTNQGQRIAHFTVDLGRNDLELIVDPMRGTIQPGCVMEIKVEILGSRSGNFLKEFWVKTEPLQRIWITGTFIPPKLKIEHPFTSNFDLIVIDFPKTYYKAENKRILIINNISSTDSMFCTVAEYNKNEDIKLDIARELNENLKFFRLTPKDGRLLKNHKAVITVSFSPYKIKTFPQKYCISFIKIMKINYRDGIIRGKDMHVKTFSSASESDSYQIADMKSSDSIYDLKWEIATSYLRICLYGEIEETNVKVTPSSIDRNNLRVGDESKLTFNIKNCSPHLPISFKYEKVACFEMEPSEATLKPSTSMDILLILKPHSMGKFVKKINLTLYYKNRDKTVFKVGNAYLRVDYTAHFNQSKISPMLKPAFVMGISSPYVSGVGHNVDNIRYDNANIDEVPVHAFVNQTNMEQSLISGHTELIGFPNDRPNWIYPWRNDIPCTTIFAHIPRYNTPFDFTHAFSKEVYQFKKDNAKKYINYLRRSIVTEGQSNEKKVEHNCYPKTQSKILLTNEKICGCLTPFSEVEKWPKFIPLTPEELMDIIITPRYVVLGKIAPHIICSDFFEIKNFNRFPVIISIIAISNSVIVKGKKRLTIEAKQSAKLYFDCFSHGLGKYYVPVFIIINDYHVFDATVFAEVVPTTVKCRYKEVTINAKDNVGYLELFNPVNCDIDFAWDVQDKNYSIMPKQGKIESRKSLYCKIDFTPKIDSIFKTEIYLLSQSGAKQIVKVANDQIKVYVKFSSQQIEMKHIPVNIAVSKRLVVRNDSEQAIVMYVRNPNPIEQINITPTEGFVEGKCDIFFKITAHFKTITTFTCNLEFVMQDGREYAIHVFGTVTFPNVILEPEFMHIPKIVTSAYQRRVFRINNYCWAMTKVRFLLDHYPDLTVTDLNRKQIVGEITLGPRDYIELYLEFQPKEPTAYTLYLPYIINDFIGPPLLNNPNSFKIGTYLDPPTTEISRPMSTLRITCAAGAPWFKFSPFLLKFTEEKLKKEFHITNISASFHKIKFMIEDLDNLFDVHVASCTGKYKVDNKYIRVSLESMESIVLIFKFNTEDYGICEVDVPFYVTDYFENCPFNYIRLQGTKNQPKIEAKNKMMSMPTIPVKKFYVRSVKLSLYHHKPDCSITSESNHEFLKVEMKIEIDTVEVTVTFFPKHECNVVTEVNLFCSCGASCTLYVRAACDNCSLLSYRHKMKWWSEGHVALEPQDSSFDTLKKSCSKKIQKLNQIIEKYVFSQGFFSTYYYRIPATISRYPYSMYTVLKDSRGKPRKNEKTIHLPIVTFFKNLSSPAIIHFLIDGVNYGSLDERQGAAYDYSVYKNVLKFLEDYNVFVKNLSPELLLNYERYIVFKTQLIDEDNMSGDEILPEDEFNGLSQQCWLDFIIKIYKLLHYDRLLKDVIPKTGKLEVDDVYQQEFGEYYASQIESFPSGINECEAKLMLWVEFHFKEQKKKLWPDSKVPDRQIRDLSKDLRDSLPLATLMAAYCPYLADTFKEIYFEEFDTTGHCPLHHNACLISEAWNRLQLSFKISTTSIFEPINIEILFLLSYLYVVLPSFYPLQTVTIKAHLGKTSSAKVVLKNTGPVAVSYSAILFLNENESFQIATNNVIIAPKGEKDLLVSYTAKQIIKEEAVLVLSGENGGQKFSKSMAVNLIGIPEILYFTQEFKIKVQLYETVSKTMDVISPYAQPYYANTYFYLYKQGKLPLTMKDFVSVAHLPGLPRQLELDAVCAFDEEGMHKLTIRLCFISLGEWTYYIYFTNKDVGIFCIKVCILAMLSELSYETIPVRIQTNFDANAPCKCKSHTRNLMCPRILYADIPYQNPDLIEGLRNMIRIYARQDEIEFWNTHLVFSKGVHIFRAYLENTYHDELVPFKRVLNPTVSFYTETESKHCSVENMIHFEDATSEGCYKLMIHWDSSEFPDREKLFLIAEHGLEPRTYVLKFWTRETRISINE